VGDKAVFSASFGGKSMMMTVWDLIAQAVSGAIGAPAPAAADLAETYAAFAELAPVKSALAHFNPWPPFWKLPWAASQAAWDLSEAVRNDYERAALKSILERLFRRKITGLGWVSRVNALLAPYNMLKILRDEAVWAIQTWSGDPVIVFTAYHSSGLMSYSDGGGSGPTGLVRPAGVDVSFDLVESADGKTFNFTLKNVQGAALWEWRVGLDGDQPQPTAVSAPPGWKWDVVWSMDERAVRFWTEGPNGWASGDFGQSVIPEGGSLSGFSFTIPYRLQQCSFTAAGTDQRIDGGMLSLVPALSAAPPDFAPTEGETTALHAYLDRPAFASIKVYSNGSEYVTVAAEESHPAGNFSGTWDGRGPDGQVATPGDYEARLHIVYADGSVADVSAPLQVVTGLMVGSVGELSGLPDGRAVRLAGQVVTAAASGSPAFIYVEEPDRSGGIKVMTSQPAAEGDILSISGSVSHVDGELAIADATIEIGQTGGSPPAPLGIAARSLGGTGSGIAGRAGLYNIGLLVRVWGRVTEIEQVTPPAVPSWFRVDDGSVPTSPVKVLCPGGVNVPSVGSYAIVTGISSCEKVGEDLFPLVRVRRQADIRTVQ